ncbi:MAG: AAA family ATPase [Dehalococcoidia bacterium]|nr:AAA family ATPase [Dehalococcoidia bacterium]
MNNPFDPMRPAPEEFLVTKEYRRFAEFCDACKRHRYIGLCYGPPGVGKTLSARHYAQWDVLEPILRAQRVTLNPPTAPEVAAARSIVYTPTVTVTPKQLATELGDLLFDLGLAVELALHPDEDSNAIRSRPWTELVLVDEADRLKTVVLEQLRDLYDRGRFALVLIGMPGLEKRLARYPQLYSRVGFVHNFRPLSAEEMRFILNFKWEQLGLTLCPEDFTDAEAIAAIIRITGGNFRLVQRLFTQIERILRLNEMHTVTKEVVEAARENLVIGIV